MVYNIKKGGDSTELRDLKTIHTSERGEISVGEGSDGRRYARKTGKFNTEVLRKIAGINSPYIMKITRFSENEVIMEYIDGEPLSEAKLPRDLYGIFRELCEGISALHSAGIIHRDIKPSNIMLCGGHIKIIDFDAARLKKPEAEKDTSFIGTDGFAPPEQYGFQQTDERSDIYSIGVTMKLLLRENYQRSPLRSVAEKCMQFDPNRRYASATAVSRALRLCRLRPVIIGSAAALAICAALILFLNIKKSSEAVPAVSAAVTEITSVSTAEAASESIAETTSATSYFKTLTDMTEPTEEQQDDPFSLPSGFPELPGNVSGTERDEPYIRYFYWEKMTREEAEEYTAEITEWAEKTGGSLYKEIIHDNVYYNQWQAGGTITFAWDGSHGRYELMLCMSEN